MTIEFADHFSVMAGGWAGQFAAALAQLGHAASVIGRVPDSQAGDLTRRLLRSQGVDCRHVRTDLNGAVPTATMRENRRENDRARLSSATDQCRPTLDDIGRCDFTNAAALVVSPHSFIDDAYREITRAALEAARQADCPIVISLDWRSPSAMQIDGVRRCIPVCTMLMGREAAYSPFFLEDMTLDHFARRRVEQSVQKGSGPTTLIITRGERGSLFYSPSGKLKAGIYPVDAVRDGGAAIAFQAAALGSLLSGEARTLALRTGSAAASVLLARRRHARQWPNAAEVASLIHGSKMTFDPC